MAQTAQEVQDALSESITEPQSATNDAGSVTMPSTYNQLLLLKYLKNQEVQESGRDLPKFRRLKMGGPKVV